MTNDSQYEKDVEFVSSQFLCADLPKDWNKEGEIDNEVFYTWLEQNAWYPYEDWTGEKLFGAIVDLAVDMRAYIELERRVGTEIKILDREDIKGLVDKAGSVFNLSKETGVREVSLYRYLNGTVEPTIQTLKKLNQYSEEVEEEVSK